MNQSSTQKLSKSLKDLAERARTLGTFTSSALGSGFDEEAHGALFADLLDKLGSPYPIPVLEQAVKFFRNERSITLANIKDELFESGMSSITMEDGTEIGTTQEIGITVANKPAMNSWLEGRGYGAIIKTSFEFAKGIDTTAIEADLQSMGIPYEKDTDVHHQSLKKAIREIMDHGGDLPESDVATISVVDIGTIKAPKRR
jgi:hypothetical protein